MMRAICRALPLSFVERAFGCATVVVVVVVPVGVVVVPVVLPVPVPVDVPDVVVGADAVVVAGLLPRPALGPVWVAAL